MSIRSSMINMLKRYIAEEHASELERGAYNYSIKSSESQGIQKKWVNTPFRNIYLNKCRSIYDNINPDSYIKNNYLQENIEKGNITPYNVAFMTPREIFPENWSSILEKQKRKRMEDTETPKASTNQFKCKKCGKRECTYYQLQTRSADEPMTNYIHCVNCGNRWKI